MSALLDRLRDDLEEIAEGQTLGASFSPREAADLLAELDRRVDEYEGWADVELMGHRRRIAQVRRIDLAGRGFLELTGAICGIPYRELYAPSAVFCLIPIDDEDTASRLQEAAGRPQF